MNWFELEGFIILRSSKYCYHVVFNRTVSWSENVMIMAWVAMESQNLNLKDYALMQCIKMPSALRVSSKKEKSPPRIVFRYGKQDKEIRNYLQHRRLIKNIIRKLS